MKEISREEATEKAEISNNGIASQEAIVKIMSQSGQVKKFVHVIPGGANLTKTEDESTLKYAIYNWIRRAGDFERFEISFMGDYDDLEDLTSEGVKPRKKIFVDFNYKDKGTIFWKRKGVQEVSVKLAQALLEAENPISAIVEKTGIYLVSDSSKTFSPESSTWNPVLIYHRVIG